MPLSKAMPKLVADQNNAILVSNTFQEIYHTLEKEGDKGGKKLKLSYALVRFPNPLYEVNFKSVGQSD